MIDKCVDLADGIKEIRDGDCIVIGGWGPFRKPMSLIRKIVQSPLKDLTIYIGNQKIMADIIREGIEEAFKSREWKV